jgi:hypothetical protein
MPPAPIRRSSWHGFDRAPLARLPLVVGGGILAGAVGGAVSLTWAIGDRSSIAGLAIGAVSVAVLGGWFAFLGSSFYSIFRHGWREAVEAEDRKNL